MPTRIVVTVDDLQFEGTLNDSETAAALTGRLPLAASMSRWGDEYYGGIGDGLKVEQAADARAVMEPGELAYWLPGKALCIFFGPTPVSEGDEPRAASPVNPVGRISGDLEALKRLAQNVTVRVEAAAG